MAAALPVAYNQSRNTQRRTHPTGRFRTMPTTTPTAPPLTVRDIASLDARRFILAHHYSHQDGTARSVPGIRHCWSLWERERLVGVVTFSNPVSYTLCRGVCGPHYRKDVLELSRLVVTTPAKNAASFLIGASLRLLARIRNAIVVSYADCNDHVGHVGYVYQACNFTYTGNGSIVPTYVDMLTGETVAHTRRHIDVKARRHGPLKSRPQRGKHRYVTFVGDRRFKRQARSALRYPVLPFPKGPSRRHDTADSEPVPASPRLSSLARTANREHALAEAADRERLEHYEKAGLILLEAKRLCGHGRWQKWMIANLVYGKMTASRYMRFATWCKSNNNVTFADRQEAWECIRGVAAVPAGSSGSNGQTERAAPGEDDTAALSEADTEDAADTDVRAIHLYPTAAQAEQLLTWSTRLMREYKLRDYTALHYEAVRRWAAVK
jgi:hypothetical protein